MGQLRQEMQLKLLDPLYKSVHEQLAQAGRLSDTQLDKLVAAVRETLAREMSKAAAASPANMPQSPMGQVMGSQPRFVMWSRIPNDTMFCVSKMLLSSTFFCFC